MKCVNSVVIKVCYHAVEEWLFTEDNEFLEMHVLPIKDAWSITDVKVFLLKNKAKESMLVTVFQNKQYFLSFWISEIIPHCAGINLVVVYTMYSNPLSSRRHWNCLLNCCNGGVARVMYQVCSLRNEQYL